MNQNAMIGTRIRTLRLAKRLTLKQMSEASGLSVGFLSQLERGMSSIAVDSLASLAAILDVSLSSLFDISSTVERDPVVHSFDLRSNPISPQMIQFMLCHDADSFSMLPRLFLLQPMADGAQEQIEMSSHMGEEFAYVLEGIVTMHLAGQRHTLYPGDSVQIRSNMQHRWMNLSSKPARLLSIRQPNPFSAAGAE